MKIVVTRSRIGRKPLETEYDSPGTALRQGLTREDGWGKPSNKIEDRLDALEGAVDHLIDLLVRKGLVTAAEVMEPVAEEVRIEE